MVFKNRYIEKGLSNVDYLKHIRFLQLNYLYVLNVLIVIKHFSSIMNNMKSIYICNIESTWGLERQKSMHIISAS